MSDWTRVLLAVGGVVLVGGGVQALWRREVARRRQWGEFGGRAAYPPLRGGAAVWFGLWCVLAGAALLAWAWRG